MGMAANKRPPVTYDHAGESVHQCVGCGVLIFFKHITNRKGFPSRIPVEYGGPHSGENHFAHCPNASDFRTRRTGPQQGRKVKFKKD